MSKKNVTAKELPAYRIYGVSGDGEKKSVWTEIGAAWKHKDGKGLSLQFSARPLEGAQIVLREPTAKKVGETSSRQMTGRYDALTSKG